MTPVSGVALDGAVMPLASAICHDRMYQFLPFSAWDVSIDKDIMMSDQHPSLILEEVTDPTAIAQAQAQGERCARNMAWLQAHAAEIYPRYRGKYLCIAGETLFVADTPEEAWALATAAHPEDDGRFLYYVPREVLARIYAH